MPLIRLSTFIRAPAEVCFDLARSIDLHTHAPGPLRHRAVGGVTRGLIGLGEEVTWEASIFGVRLHMTSKIVACERPREFTDEMRRGPFARWRHTHSFEPVDEATRELARSEIEENARRAYDAYERMLEQGIAKEIARAVLPLSTYTKYYWSCNPRSLMHFCGLRNHESAQYEIRQYAAAAESFLQRLMPITHEAFVQNDRVAP